MGKNIGQQAAFILLDAAVAYGVKTAPGEETAMNLAVRRLNEVPGMVNVKDEGDSRRVDISPIVNGAIVSTYALAFWLAQERGVPIENIFAELRETHEGLWDE